MHTQERGTPAAHQLRTSNIFDYKAMHIQERGTPSAHLLKTSKFLALEVACTPRSAAHLRRTS